MATSTSGGGDGGTGPSPADRPRLETLLRVALGGNMPAQHRLGDAWFDRRDAGRVAARYLDLAPLQELPAGTHRLPTDEVLPLVARGIAAWLPEAESDLPPGLDLTSDELALVHRLALASGFGEDTTLASLDGQELLGRDGRFLTTLKADTAARWRVRACAVIAGFLLAGRAEGSQAETELRRLLLGGDTNLRADDPRLLDEFGLRSLITDDEHPPYVPRDADGAIRRQLANSRRKSPALWERLLVVAGPPKSGKTRTILEALSSASGEWSPERARVLPIRTPAGGDLPLRALPMQLPPLRKQLRDDTIVVLVDDLQEHIAAGTLPRQDLGALLRADPELVVVATVHDELLVEGLPTPGYSDLDVQLLRGEVSASSRSSALVNSRRPESAYLSSSP